MGMETKVLLDGLAFGESPRWHDGRLWFSDMLGYQVMAVDLPGRAEKIIKVPEFPSGHGWLPDGAFTGSINEGPPADLESDNPVEARIRLSGRVEIVEVEVPGVGLP
jgi:hypothetical protein